MINEKTKKEKRTCQTMDFAVLADHRVKIKVREKRDNAGVKSS